MRQYKIMQEISNLLSESVNSMDEDLPIQMRGGIRNELLTDILEDAEKRYPDWSGEEIDQLRNEIEELLKGLKTNQNQQLGDRMIINHYQTMIDSRGPSVKTKNMSEEDESDRGFWLGCRRILDQLGELGIVNRLDSSKYASREEVLQIIEEELLEQREELQNEYDDAMEQDEKWLKGFRADDLLVDIAPRAVDTYAERYGYYFSGEDINPHTADPSWEVKHHIDLWVGAGREIPDYCQHLALYTMVVEKCRFYVNSNLFCMIAEGETWDMVAVAQECIDSFMEKYLKGGE